MLVRESPEELTLKADDVGTWKSCINVHHVAKERWGPPLVDADRHAFCQAINKGIEGQAWEELYDCCTEMSRAARVKKPQEAPKSESSLEDEGSQGRGTGIPRSRS